MKKSNKIIRKKPIPQSFAGQVYLDPRYEPAFKELFDSEDALKDFLDGVLGLEGDDKIRTIKFVFDKSIRFRVTQSKKIIFDVFITTNSGRYLDVEMQKLDHDFLVDRIVLYNAFLVIKGKKEMERSEEFLALSKEKKEKKRYELPETISIWICDFELPYAKGEYKDEWAVYSQCSIRNGRAIPIFPKNKYIFFSLPNFKKTLKEIDGSVDAWLYLLSHAGDGGELPDFGSDIIRDALDRIRVDNADDKLLLDQEKYMSLKDDYRIVLASAIIRAKEEGRARGLARGLAEGRAEGRAEGAREKGRKIAAFLRAKGVSENLILDALAQK